MKMWLLVECWGIWTNVVRKGLVIYEKNSKNFVWNNNRCYDKWNCFVPK